MLKKYKKEIIFGSLLTLIPILIGILLWNQLPDLMTTHWSANSQPDGYAPKAFAVFGIPLLLLGIHWLSLWITRKDPGFETQSKKAFGIIFWIIPVINLFVCCIMYGVALGQTVNMTSILFVLMGLLFICIGNYLPKIKKNYTLGIKVIWTLSDEENWYATHRFGGKVMVLGGLLMTASACFPVKYSIIALLPVTLSIALLPMLYSYLYYKKQCSEGRGYSLKNLQVDESAKTVYRVSTVVLIAVVALLIAVMCFGQIKYVYNSDSFTIEASFYNDMTVEYDSIDSIEIRYESVPGTRVMGFGSPRMLLGTFENEEFGQYTRYTCTSSKCSIILTSADKTLVVSGKDTAETELIYASLLEKTGLER